MEVFDEIKKRLKGNIVLLGMGNPLKSDDGIGTILASRLEGKISLNVFSAGAMPENYLDKIARTKPDTILMIDAADFGGRPGKMRFFRLEEIHSLNFFATHNISPKVIIGYLRNSTSANIIFLAIQPKHIDFGRGLSKDVEISLLELERFFLGSYRK